MSAEHAPRMMRRALFDQDFARLRSSRPSAHIPVNRRYRAGFVLALAVLWSLALVWRLYHLQIEGNANWKRSASRQQSTTVALTPERGKIFDRNGKVLAISVPSGSVYVRPRQLKALWESGEGRLSPEELADKLSHILQMPQDEIFERMNRDKPFVWLKRQIPRVQAQQIDALAVSGLGYFVESRRYNPYETAASSVIGKVGIDGVGLSGMEARYDGLLKGAGQDAEATRDALGNIIADKENMVNLDLPAGKALRLTIDADFQTIMDEEVSRGHEFAKAKHVLAVLINADTGEILAMSQTPLVNFNMEAMQPADLRNYVVETVFEPGSVMKPLVVAAALELGVLQPQEHIDCEGGRYAFGRHTINDVHPKGVLSVKDIIVQSSNIGMTKIALRMGSEKLHASLRAFGFGEAIPLGLPGETRGILRPLKSWAKVDLATHSFGQGMAVTTLQLLRAVAVIVNGGYLPTLTLVPREEPESRLRILSKKNADLVADMMIGVVEDERGTGQRAAVTGVRIGGKTGTAQRARDGGRGYDAGSYIASFIGFGDASSIGIQEKLVLGVVVDRPNTNTIYGGTLAAPVFRRIMQRSMHVLETRKALR